MSALLRDLAQLVDGTLCGDGDLVISGAATIRHAGPGDITLAEDIKTANQVAESGVSAVVVPHGVRPTGTAYLSVADVHAAFAQIVQHFRPPPRQCRIGISPAAHISPHAKIGPDVDVYPGAYIGDDVQIGAGSTVYPGVRIMAHCHIGQQVTLFPNVVLYENTRVGDRVILHAGAVIGAYGFGYTTIQGRHQRAAQLGYVEIGSDVEIGACSTVDRGTYGPTTIGEGTKIDNQVMIAHNCQIGRHNLLCSHVGIAGSCTTGDYVVMAGQVGIGDHIHIGHHVTLGAKAGVMHDIRDGESHVGIPATPVREQMIKQAALAKLPEMRKQLKQLERAIGQSARQAGLPAEREAA